MRAGEGKSGGRCQARSLLLPQRDRHPPIATGDDVNDDVRGAQRAGMAGVLVRTGKYRSGDEATPGQAPDATVADFAAAVDWILTG